MTKKTLSLILAVLMIFTCIPLSAGAVVLPQSPTEFEVYSGVDYIEMSWDETAMADGYRVFIRKDGKWKTLGDTDFGYFKVDDLQPITTYKFAVRAYRTFLGKRYYSENYSSFSVKTTSLPDFPYFEGSVENGVVTLEWSYIDAADGYRIYIRKNGKWEKVVTVGDDTTSYDIKGLKPGAHYFTVRAYMKTSNGIIWSKLAKTVKVVVSDPQKVVITSASSSEKAVKLNWQKVSGATGYRVYIYKNSKWTAVKTTTANTYTVTSLKPNREYSFRVRAYKKTSSKTVWYPASNTYKVMTKALLKDRQEVCEIYNKAVNYAKNYKGTLTLNTAETIDLEVKNVPAVVENAVKSVINNFEGPINNKYIFKNGVDSSGCTSDDQIAPYGQKASLTAAGISWTKVKTYRDKSKYIQFCLVKEIYRFDENKSNKPKHHNASVSYIDFGAIDSSPITIEEAEGVYENTVVSFKVDSKGRLVSRKISLTSDNTVTSKLGTFVMTFDIDADVLEKCTFSYK